ncbi:DUF6210 family protein [Lentzea sp. BCCO 10_0061]|uniref:DUF6210 family protein n=1 Tax=Lentzea sokolovensis TaxID=3095429 RepID=A0ABU4VBL8_9PSEU|nr:DUF6210 family protein [Lentzea sp. BCCO 10_0061]MDX8149202.1 DUF6210 family protein [Lentzea sp. BCCO 10_0061]
MFEPVVAAREAAVHEHPTLRLPRSRRRCRRRVVASAVRARGTTELTVLRLDESRIREADEAWIPVITPDGPGLLVWCNSD